MGLGVGVLASGAVGPCLGARQIPLRCTRRGGNGKEGEREERGGGSHGGHPRS